MTTARVALPEVFTGAAGHVALDRGPDRSAPALGGARSHFSDIREIRTTFGSTVNDVLLAVMRRSVPLLPSLRDELAHVVAGRAHDENGLSSTRPRGVPFATATSTTGTSSQPSARRAYRTRRASTTSATPTRHCSSPSAHTPRRFKRDSGIRPSP